MTDKLHFDDLTKINCPFGMLDGDTQERLKACGDVEYFSYGEEWRSRELPFVTVSPNITYRQKPKPKMITEFAHYHEAEGLFITKDYYSAKYMLSEYGGHIYRIEFDQDGGNPTIEKVEY